MATRLLERHEVTLGCEQSSRPVVLSAFVRPAHQLQGIFDVPPSLGLLAVALLLEGTSFLSGLGNGLVAVRVQQLPRVVLDFDFLHSHGVMLLFVSAVTYRSRTETPDVDTLSRPAMCILAHRNGTTPHWLVMLFVSCTALGFGLRR